MQNGGRTDKLAAFFATSEKMLIEVYGHLHPEHHREAADTMGMRPVGREWVDNYAVFSLGSELLQ